MKYVVVLPERRQTGALQHKYQLVWTVQKAVLHISHPNSSV